MNELTIAATVENIETVTDFVNGHLEALECPMKAQMQINIAIDELFGNIAHYAYHPEVGEATVRVEVIQDPLSVVITFIDNGIPYDPLTAAVLSLKEIRAMVDEMFRQNEEWLPQFRR